MRYPYQDHLPREQQYRQPPPWRPHFSPQQVQPQRGRGFHTQHSSRHVHQYQLTEQRRWPYRSPGLIPEERDRVESSRNSQEESMPHQELHSDTSSFPPYTTPYQHIQPSASSEGRGTLNNVLSIQSSRPLQYSHGDYPPYTQNKTSCTVTETIHSRASLGVSAAQPSASMPTQGPHPGMPPQGPHPDMPPQGPPPFVPLNVPPPSMLPQGPPPGMPPQGPHPYMPPQGPPPGMPPQGPPPGMPPQGPPPGMPPQGPPPGMSLQGPPPYVPPNVPPPGMPLQGPPPGMPPQGTSPDIPPQRPYSGKPPLGPKETTSQFQMQQGTSPSGVLLPFSKHETLSTSDSDLKMPNSGASNHSMASHGYSRLGNQSQQQNDNFSSTTTDRCVYLSSCPGMNSSKSHDNVNQADDRKHVDRKWIEEFVNNRKEKSSAQKRTLCELSVPKAHSLLKEALHLKQKLLELLEAVKCSEVADIKNISDEFGRIKKQLEDIELVFNKEGCIASLKMRLKRIQTKRAAQKRRRKRHEVDREETLARRREIEAQIDKWQAGLIQKELDTKKAEELKAAVDQVLAEVSRKQLEATRGLDLLEALTKLREVRRLKAEQRGVNISSVADEMFRKRMHGLRDLLDRQLSTYKEEDKALRVMMDVEQEETKERERELQQLKEEKKQQTYKENITEFLFGKTEDIGPDNPLFTYRQYYESAQHHLESFIQIRHQWDIYIVDDDTDRGSRMPIGWVVPEMPSDGTWATALKDNQLLFS